MSIQTTTLAPATTAGRTRDVFDALCDVATLTLRIGRHLVCEASVSICGVQVELTHGADAWQVGQGLGLPFLEVHADPVTGEARRVAYGNYAPVGYVEVYSDAQPDDVIGDGLVVA